MLNIRTLASTGNGEHDFGRMPCTNTSDLAKTFVCLPWQLLGTPTSSNTLEPMTLRDSNDVHTLILLEYCSNIHGLLKQAVCKLDLVCYRATIHLDLHQMSFLLR